MVDQIYCLWSLISLLLHLFQVLRKAISMPLSSFLSTHGFPPPPLSWKWFQESSALQKQESIPRSVTTEEDEYPQEVLHYGARAAEENHHPLPSEAKVSRKPRKRPAMIVVPSFIEEGKEKDLAENHHSLPMGTAAGEAKVSRKPKKRPAMIVVPKSCMVSGFIEEGREKDLVDKELEVEGSDYCLASKKGSRHMMEDGYGAITNIHGDSKQAFFGVFDGHGGRAAVDFVTEKLWKNIKTALSELEEDDPLELAIRTGYLSTDTEFLSQGVRSGACVATALLQNGELHVSNVGDCRVVMSMKGVATALTFDHRAGREDERVRIESSGGYVSCRNGVWRVQDSLAISRAIGDVNMKEWVISEPETKRVRLTSDCEFLIMASDGLWDKVSNQEAVDVVLKQGNSMKSCRDLVDMASMRGSRDDITVMVVDLRRFVQLGG